MIGHFLSEWIDGRPGGSAREPSYRTLGGHFPGVLADRVCYPEGWFVRAPDTSMTRRRARCPSRA